jgi:hypothetical protein
MDQPHQRPDWHPAPTNAGEFYATYGYEDDPRLRAHRRSAMVTAVGLFVAGAIVLFVAYMAYVLM